MFKPGLAPDLLGPFQPGAYIGAYVVIALCNAFVAAALCFSIAALSRSASAGYLVAALLFLTAFVVRLLVAGEFGNWELAKIIDPLGLSVISEIDRTTTPLQKNTIGASIGLKAP
ncbi:MAG: hypothetical protein ACREAB_06055 [Blastocatellia bacterium]